MNKREKIKFINSVFDYLGQKTTEAFEAKDELNFDWYSEGQEAFLCVLQDTPIKITPRVKRL